MLNLKIPKWFESPEFLALHDSNLPPSDVQRNILIEMQGLLKEELGNTTVEKSYLKSIETILSPIKALPYDILIEVFLHCLPKRVTFHLRRRSNILENVPLLLTHICSSWRSLVLETPSFWTTLTFVADNYIETYNLSLCTEASEFCKLWFSRAKNLPLNFNLHVPYPADSKQCDLFELFMKETLLGYLPRFRNLMLASYEIGAVLELLGWIQYNSNQEHKIQMSCDMLETLEFQSTGYLNVREEEREMRGFLEIFKHAPRLRRLVWNMDGKRAPDIYLPLQVLTNLSISRLPPSHINSLVRKCPSLRCGAFHLTVEDDEDDEEEESGPPQRFILEHLHSLLIITNNDSPMDPFKNMEFPALTSLFLSSSRQVHETSHIEPFLPHLHNIQRLVLLHVLNLSEEQWLTLLRSTPNLVELELANHYDVVYQFLFKEMIITEDDKNGREPLIPHLQILVIEFIGYMYRDKYYAKAPELFIAMVQSRWRGSGNALASESKCLHSVSFFVVSQQSKEAEVESIMQKISDRLQACVDAGLELNIHRNQYKKDWMLDASYDISDLHDSLMASRQLVKR